MNPKVKGYTLGAIAAATYGMNPLFALPLYSAGMDPLSVLFFRYLLALPILGAMIKLRGRSFRISTADLLPLMVFGVLFALSSITLFSSYQHMDAGIASTMLFVYPIMVALIMAALFRERLTWQTVLCLLMAVGGIALLYRSADGATLSLVGTLLVMGSALAYAIYIVGINKGRLKEMPTLKVTFYVLAFGWTIFAAHAIYTGHLHTPPAASKHLWLNLIALALLPTIVSLLCTTRAIQLIGSTPTAILGALEPVTAVFFGIVVFGEQLTLRQAVGMVLIVAAVSVVVAGKQFSAYMVRLRKMFPRINRKNNANN